MQYWLMKSEPNLWSIDQQKKAGMKGATWDGVRNYQAANKSIRENLTTLSKEMDCKTIYPDLKFCGDNAAMIERAGIKRFKKNLIDNIDISAKSRWPLDNNAPYMKGPGLKL